MKILEEFNQRLSELAQLDAQTKAALRQVKAELIAALSPIKLGDDILYSVPNERERVLRVERLEVIQAHKSALATGIMASGPLLNADGSIGKLYGRKLYSLQAGVTRHTLK